MLSAISQLPRPDHYSLHKTRWGCWLQLPSRHSSVLTAWQSQLLKSHQTSLTRLQNSFSLIQAKSYLISTPIRTFDALPATAYGWCDPEDGVQIEVTRWVYYLILMLVVVLACNKLVIVCDSTSTSVLGTRHFINGSVEATYWQMGIWFFFEGHCFTDLRNGNLEIIRWTWSSVGEAAHRVYYSLFHLYIW